MSQYQNKPELAELTLGQVTEYHDQYDPSLLQPVPRKLNREELHIVESQPFVGTDVWYGYELSWLNAKGKPVVALGRFSFSANSINIVESKSFKLYLNSFNQSRFPSIKAVKTALETDLAACSEGDVHVVLISPSDNEEFAPTELPGTCIDGLDIEVDSYQLDSSLLKCDENTVATEVLHSHLLKSNCLITNQPDWASVVIEYSGAKIEQESLLRYLISFRQHNEFHEQCVERIFMDISNLCQPTNLAVQALYTRRGGLDINPYRCTKTSQSEKFAAPVRRGNRQ